MLERIHSGGAVETRLPSSIGKNRVKMCTKQPPPPADQRHILQEYEQLSTFSSLCVESNANSFFCSCCIHCAVHSVVSACIPRQAAMPHQWTRARRNSELAVLCPRYRSDCAFPSTQRTEGAQTAAGNMAREGQGPVPDNRGL